jgi:hypothetical protein
MILFCLDVAIASPERFPRLTNGELMRIAGVDIAAMHGWIYLNRDLPAPAIDRLHAYIDNRPRLPESGEVSDVCR